MRDIAYYKKYKTSYTPAGIPLFSKGNVWLIVAVILVALFTGPLLLYYKYHRVSFSFEHYFRQVQYFALIIVPLGSFLVWTNWREVLKRNRGYGWIGKFEVIGKQASFIYCYLLLSGEGNKIKVTRDLFNQTRVGDFITIDRNAFGKIEEIKKLNGIKTRLRNASLRLAPEKKTDKLAS